MKNEEPRFVSEADEGKAAEKRKKAEARRQSMWRKEEAQRITDELDARGIIRRVRVCSFFFI
jgi:hypothetical protein